jgi:transposase
MGLGATRDRSALWSWGISGAVVPGTHGVSAGSSQKARPGFLIRMEGNDMNLFFGFDVSLASTAICIVDDHGKILNETAVATEPEALAAVLHSLPGTVIAVGLEAGPLSQWLHKDLTDAGFPVVLMETRQVRGALQAMPIKTDRRDAEGIARLLQMGWFRPVHCKSVSAQETRALLTARKSVQQAIINLELSLRGVLRNFGLRMGVVAKGGYDCRVREMTVGNPMLVAAAEPVLRARVALRKELAGLERQVRDLARQDPVCRLMMTMPGVGVVVALTAKSAIDDPARFRCSKDVGPWTGLTPGRHQSGERDVIGQITRAGDAGLRTALYHAALSMMHRGRPNWLKAWGLNVARRRGKKRAVVGLARRIGVVLHRMWVDGTEFRFTRDMPGETVAAA